MFWKNRKEDGRVERLAEEIPRRIAMSDEEIEAISSGIHYAGIRARIRAKRAETAIDQWAAVLMIARQAIAALSIVAVVAAGWLWLAGSGASVSGSIDDALRGSGGAGVERVRVGGTCAISASDECAISTEDVLATLVKETGK
ncbi:MAG: hypothetical protein AB1631_23635 [Acidobacteriota bacterium]